MQIRCRAYTLALVLIGCFLNPSRITAITACGVCESCSATRNPYFGDLHVHTSYSQDAFDFGTRNDPVAAYLFARGTTIPLTGGQTATIDRPLDFMAVTDHAESLDSTDWSNIQSAAATAYEPCAFTSFNGYEWTGGISTFGSKTAPAFIHRNVIFSGETVPTTAFSRNTHKKVESLWSALEAECQAPSCEAITIPHNANASKGKMFAVESMPTADAARRAKLERLSELFQVQGNSECVNLYQPGEPGYDPQCSFEHVAGLNTATDAPGYVRAGLGKGLLYYGSTGINPVEVGLIGSTDTHNGTPGMVRESTWQGAIGTRDDTASGRLLVQQYRNPGGLAVAWATENTREALFEAYKRREVYGTSGPRMIVSFYQTWSQDEFCGATDTASFRAAIDAQGVPMGGRMDGTQGTQPRFMVYATGDLVNLKEVAIIKGSAVAGAVAERVVVHPAQDSVNGDGTICWTWTDEDFDPGAAAFYYARVLEVPTWRWYHYDCAVDPFKKCKPQFDVMIQERAWTSPIWNLPL
ncbi:MAG: DUF3604 domain-containing protein [bacterium]